MSIRDGSDLIGHNSSLDKGAKEELRELVERIERLEEEKKGVADDIKDVYSEAKGRGYCTKTIRKIIALRKKDKDQRQEEEHMLDTYMAALGMI